MKRIFLILLAMVFTLLPLAGCGAEETAETFTAASGNYVVTDSVTDFVRIEMENGKTILVQLFPDTAPITVKNFQKLVQNKFYDGVTFHRIIKGFMIQGGDPTGTGSGGPGWTIKGEFASNGIANDLKHTRGVLSMARATAPDSAGSQFFIMHGDAPHLDGMYAAFGKVIDGMDTVDEIAAVKVVGDRPVEAPVMKTVRFVTPA